MSVYSFVPGKVADYVVDHLEGLAQRGRSVIVTEQPHIDTYSSFDLPDDEEDPITIRYPSLLRHHRDHLILQNTYTINRLLDAPQLERYMPDPISLEDEEIERDVGLQLGFPPSRVAARITEELMRDTAEQLLETAYAVRVDPEIWRDVPPHQFRQRVFLEARLDQYEQMLDPTIRENTPTSILAMRAALYSAHTFSCAYAVNPSSRHQQTTLDDRARAIRLLATAQNVEEPGLAGDLKVIELWAQMLGMEDWIVRSPD